MKIRLFLLFFSLISINTYSQVYYGSFTVGGSSSSFYPVLFSVSGVDGTSSLGKLSVYIDNVHANGSWSGSFHSDIEFISSNWGHIPTKIVEFTYVTGGGNAYSDPIGDIQDGSTARGGSQLIIWLKGGAIYQWSTTSNSRVTLIDGNSEGTIKTSYSGNPLNILTSQSELVVKAKNARFYQSVGLGTSGNGYFGGNVGIGTTTPNEKLEIGGNLRINNGENCSIFPTGHSLTFGGRQDYAHVSYLFRPSWGTPSPTYSNFQLQKATNNGVFTTAVMFTTDGGNSYINSGNVGIGTTSPDEKLTVNGVIHAKEVKVDLSGALADFVFKPDYKLMSLNQVEQFVKTNNHLPQMPSAEEVDKNGLSVGEMQNKLLQKVEELTLYMIGQQKTIDQQQAQIKKLNSKLSKLNKQ
jgi:hypothetical protein